MEVLFVDWGIYCSWWDVDGVGRLFVGGGGVDGWRILFLLEFSELDWVELGLCVVGEAVGLVGYGRWYLIRGFRPWVSVLMGRIDCLVIVCDRCG